MANFDLENFANSLIPDVFVSGVTLETVGA